MQSAPGDGERERKLIARAQDGDDAAWETIVEEHGMAVLRLSRRRLENLADAEDLTQITFRIAWEKLSTYRGERPLRNWLLTICNRRCIDELRRRQSRSPTVSLDAMAAGDEVVFADGQDTEVDSVTRLLIRTGLERLGNEERQAFILIKIEGLTSEEAAQRCQVPASTMRSRLARAKEQLVAMIDEDAGGER